MTTITIDPLSCNSLYLTCIYQGTQLGTATGYIIYAKGKNYLITNWHVLSGRNPQNNQPLDQAGRTPDQISIWHHGITRGTWISKTENLYTGSIPRWMEHAQGKNIDVVAIELENIDSTIKIYPIDFKLSETDLLPQIAMPVSIIGYPLGITAHGVFPVWKTGHIASEPEIDYQDLPMFLIDATTRGGMSGSPVVIRLNGGYKTRMGSYVLSGSVATKFLGTYSGRIHQDSEIGRVWKSTVLKQLLSIS